MKDFLPSRPEFLACICAGMSVLFWFLKAYGACWLFIIITAVFLAVDCICEAIRDAGNSRIFIERGVETDE